jgi:phosphoglycolate phosphatase
VYQLIVFDLDGTVLDTLDDLASATNYALQAHGYPTRTREEVRAFVGNGVKNLMDRAIGTENEQNAEVLATFRAYYGAHSADQTATYDGVIPLLEEVKRLGIKTAVLSNKPDQATKALAEKYCTGLFDCVMGENEAGGIRKKPAPDALFALIERFGVKKEEVLYLGDSEVDVETAENACVDYVCVTWGFRDEELLRSVGATRFANTPSEVLKWIKGE